VAVAMHCNLKLMPPDVEPVSLGFNYEAHNAPVYQFNTSVPALHSVTSIFGDRWAFLPAF